ncbi:unnamed protein product [Peronospora belbahrii]|uniref:FCP1 homology domain-containing protein n=1 Tax=Peronospora belbahrii TaxID=622444 RepID=A0AAU9KR44_9STRA|nr:unnamed protein product [Peronospora belbahrii]CAH0517672.1 unnamed protein product [Peronospora belbahrii]
MVLKRVAIGGTFACDDALAMPLQYLLQNAVWGVNVDLQWLQYGSLTNLDEWSHDVLHSAHPMDLVLLVVRLSDLEAPHPELHLSKNIKDNATAENGIAGSPTSQFLKDLERYDDMATNLAAAPLVVLLCPYPPTTAAQYDAIELEIQSKTEALQNVTVHSTKRLVALFQQQYTTGFYDAIADKRQHAPYTQAMLNVLGLSLCRQICRLFRSASNRKKAIVLDCDNTLWNGAVAEVGASGIELAPRFLALQRFVVAQQKRGMLLMLCSKNILADVMAVFAQRRGDMILDLDKHVIAVKVNWQPKSENIAQLAKELSLGLDSFIFIDDNPIECHEVAAALPSVTVILLEPNFSETFLDDEWVFDDGLSAKSHGRISTKEDGKRTLFYQQNLEREHLRESSSTHRAFLGALGVKIVFEELDHEQELQTRSSSFARALQLHHRTNQFNTATTFAKRLEEDALLKYVAAPNHTVVCAHVTDRFGHYGLVSVALCQLVHHSNVLRIDSFLLSCRALNRGVEHAMTRRLGEIATKKGAASLEFIWEPTERNQPALAFFLASSNMSFTEKNKDSNKTSLSSSASDTWVITSDKASKVSFFESNDSFHRNSVKMDRGIGTFLRHQFVLWLQYRALSVLQWILSFITLPHSVARLLQPSHTQRVSEIGSVGLLRVPLRNHGSLEQFLRPVLDMPNQNNFMISGDSMTDANDDKYRRKARHLTKLALANCTNERGPRVIWSANRPYANEQAEALDDLSQKAASTNSSEPSSIGLQPICKSPQCSLIIQRDSRCAFQRCRNCCYRTQRLLTRSLYHENADARQSATRQLRAEFADKAMHVSSHTCKVHQNKRRLGGLYKHKQQSLRE